jgi:hypothetical protein
MNSVSYNLAEETPSAGILRTRLADLPRIDVGGLPGMVCILTRTVKASGIDPWEVRAWLHLANGFESQTYLRQADGPLNPEPYFAIPFGSLFPSH